MPTMASQVHTRASARPRTRMHTLHSIALLLLVVAKTVCAKLDRAKRQPPRPVPFAWL